MKNGFGNAKMASNVCGQVHGSQHLELQNTKEKIKMVQFKILRTLTGVWAHQNVCFWVKDGQDLCADFI